MHIWNTWWIQSCEFCNLIKWMAVRYRNVGKILCFNLLNYFSCLQRIWQTIMGCNLYSCRHRNKSQPLIFSTFFVYDICIDTRRELPSSRSCRLKIDHKWVAGQFNKKCSGHSVKVNRMVARVGIFEVRVPTLHTCALCMFHSNAGSGQIIWFSS